MRDWQRPPAPPDRGRKSVLQSLLEWKCEPVSEDMTLPVSSYEELLARVRSLTHETIQLQRELLDHNDNERLVVPEVDNASSVVGESRWQTSADDTLRRALAGLRPGVEGWSTSSLSPTALQQEQDVQYQNLTATESLLARLNIVPSCNKESSMLEPKEEDEKHQLKPGATPDEPLDGRTNGIVHEDDGELSPADAAANGPIPPESSDRDPRLNSLYHGTWPVEHGLWHSGPSSLGGAHSTQLNGSSREVSSVMSFTSSTGGGLNAGLQGERRSYSSQQLGHKVDMVYNLLSMLQHERQDMSRTLLAMSSSPDSCAAMRQSGCLPLLVQLLHSPGQGPEVRARAALALRNVVQANTDPDRRGRREARVLRLLEQIRDYCNGLQGQPSPQQDDEADRHPGPAIAALMKLSFDEEHRLAMCQLGGLHAVAELIQVDHETHGGAVSDQGCVTLRRYAGMALTNLTFGDGANKALLCSLRPFMRALVAQLASPSEDLRQVTASVLRNLSWRADGASKQALREVGAVPALVRAAMAGTKEATLKSILSALWNLSAHCSLNKVDICAVEGALGFLVEMLTYKGPSKTLAIVENAGGILRNISSHIAVREDYRQILRDHNCLQILLQQLKSPSLTVVSNACGALWNLSARCPRDQHTLWELGAVAMLRSLVHSKHKMISMGSSAALKNLLAARPSHEAVFPLDATAKGLGLSQLPSLYVRKQRALEQELDQTLSETCDNIEPSTSPPPAATVRSFHSDVGVRPGHRLYHHHHHHSVSRSESRDSVTSTHSDSVFERSRMPTAARLLRQRGTLVLGSSVPEEDRGAASSSSRERRSQSLPHAARILQTGGGDIPIEVKRSSSASPESRGLPLPVHERLDSPSVGISGVPSSSPDAVEVAVKVPQYSPVTAAPIVRTSELPITSARAKAGVIYKKKLSGVYGDYAETDLDQPTDYSLQYQEEEEDDEPPARALHGNGPDRNSYYSDSAHEDTLKTYCTEGTPYETPYNFSTATSMSDLRCEPPTPHSEDAKEEETEPEPSPPNSDQVVVGEEAEVRQEVEQAVIPAVDSTAATGGRSSPDKPVAYCEEGTPCFSRVSSLSSLTSHPAPTGPDPVQEEVPQEQLPVAVSEEVKEQRDVAGVCPSKVVTFAGAEETPLMFSRCSSLGSLSSFEQHSIHDDRSSVISDFSRRTSGAVSPSELPDSPTQTVPPSPGPRQSGLPSVNGRRTGEVVGRPPDRERVHLLPAARHLGSRSNAPKASVFEDDVAAFKEEDTPVEFSRATSLSSLTIDDEPKISNDSVLKEARPPLTPRQSPSGLQLGAATPEEEGAEKQDREKGAECGELAPVSEGEEEADEDMLNACITVGMQGAGAARHRQYDGVGRSSVGRSGRSPGRPSGIPLKVGSSAIRRPGKAVTTPQATSAHGYMEVVSSGPGPCEDTVRTYCTEGTPAAGLSHAGSRSDLSALSVPDLSDSDNQSVGGDDNILAECIQSGMPKAKPQTSQTPGPLRRVGVNSVVPAPKLRLPAQAARDELETFATEDSPHNFSCRSSLSDLTTGSGEPLALLRRPPLGRPLSEGGCSGSTSAMLRDGYAAENDILPARGASFNSLDAKVVDNDLASGEPSASCPPSASEEVVTVLSRGGSLSSLSVDSLGSTEPTPSEQALLEQCISSGMPKSRGPSSRVASCRIPLPVDRGSTNLKGDLSPRPHSRERTGATVSQIESGMAALALGEGDVRRPKNEREPPPAPTAGDGGGGGSTTTITTTTTTAIPSSPTARVILRGVAGSRSGSSTAQAVYYASQYSEWSGSCDSTDNRVRDARTRERDEADGSHVGMDNDNDGDTAVSFQLRCEVGQSPRSEVAEEVIPGEAAEQGQLGYTTTRWSDVAEPGSPTDGTVDNRLLDADTQEARAVNTPPTSLSADPSESWTPKLQYDNSVLDEIAVFGGTPVRLDNDTGPATYSVTRDFKEDIEWHSVTAGKVQSEMLTNNGESEIQPVPNHSSVIRNRSDNDCNLNYSKDCTLGSNFAVRQCEKSSERSDEQNNLVFENQQSSEDNVDENVPDDVRSEGSTYDSLGMSNCDTHIYSVTNSAEPCESITNFVCMQRQMERDRAESSLTDLAEMSDRVLSDLDNHKITNLARESRNFIAPDGSSGLSAPGISSGTHASNFEARQITIVSVDCQSISTEWNDQACVETVSRGIIDHGREEIGSCVDESKSYQTTQLDVGNSVKVNKRENTAADVYGVVEELVDNNIGGNSVDIFFVGDMSQDISLPSDKKDTADEIFQTETEQKCEKTVQKQTLRRLLSDIQEDGSDSPTKERTGRHTLPKEDIDLDTTAIVGVDDRTYSLDSLSPDSNLVRPEIATFSSSSSAELKPKSIPAAEKFSPDGTINQLPEVASSNLELRGSQQLPRSGSDEDSEVVHQKLSIREALLLSETDSVQTPSPLDNCGSLTGIIADSALVMRQSCGGDTWNEEVSPNEVSFPSLTVPEDSDSGGLDGVRPPSMMASLVSMTTSSEGGAALTADAEAVAAAVVAAQQFSCGKHSSRKRSLPSLMVRRALGSLENLSGDNGCVSASSSCTSQLEHVRPPADMESSMLSVASITSEVAEVEEDLPDGGASCSTGGEETTESGSGGGVTGPTKTRGGTSGPARATPRQRRQAARDRFRTYTVSTAAAAAAELRSAAADEVLVEVTTPVSEQPPIAVGEQDISPPSGDNEAMPRTGTYRITPKQRRQEDRQRFQTQVLERPTVLSPPSPAAVVTEAEEGVVPNTVTTATVSTRSHRRRSSDNRDRFRTRTIEPADDDENRQIFLQPSDDTLLLNGLLEREANIVAEDIDTLRSGDSLLLDCETLSLVSVDSENTSESGPGEQHIDLTREQLEDEDGDADGDGDAEEKTLRAGGCYTPDPEVLFADASAELEEVPMAPCDPLGSHEVPRSISPPEVPKVAGTPHSRDTSEDSEGRDTSSSDDEDCAQKRPRIVKPVTRSRDTSTDTKGSGGGGVSPKPVRGRRRAMRGGRSGIPVTATNTSKTVSVPADQQQGSTDPEFRPPERQGTFTKDEPTTAAPPKATTTNDPTRKKKKPGPSGRLPVANPSTTTQPPGAKRNAARREATSKIASLWKKVEESKAKQKQQQLQKKDSRVWIGGASQSAPPATSTVQQKMGPASTGRGRGTLRGPVSRIPTVESTTGTARGQRKDVSSVPTRTERIGSGPVLRNSWSSSGSRLRKGTREDPGPQGSVPMSSANRPFARSGNPRPASAVVQPFNYNPPATPQQHPAATTRSQIPTPVKRDDVQQPQIGTASIRVTTV